MKIAKIASDYCPATSLCIVQTDDGDIGIRIFGNGEFRIATSGGRYRGQRLYNIVNKFSELIDLINGGIEND